jgi:hypothetical protein
LRHASGTGTHTSLIYSRIVEVLALLTNFPTGREYLLLLQDCANTKGIEIAFAYLNCK